MFDTNVNNATEIICYVDIVIENKDYGIVTSSVYNLRNSSDTIINKFFLNHNLFLNNETNSGNDSALVFLITKFISLDIGVFSGLISINVALFCFA